MKYWAYRDVTSFPGLLLGMRFCVLGMGIRLSVLGMRFCVLGMGIRLSVMGMSFCVLGTRFCVLGMRLCKIKPKVRTIT